MGLRNVARQKDRSLTTVVQVALAVATLLGLVSLGHAVSQTTKRSWPVLDYDITLSAEAGGHWYGAGIVSAVRAQSGVAAVEAVDESQLSYKGQTLYALGVHAPFIDETLTAGHWLRRANRGPRLGSWSPARPSPASSTCTPGRERRRAAAGECPFTVIGVGASDANNGFNIYTTLGALQAATGHPGVANTLLVRAASKAHPAIDTLASRLEDRRAGPATRAARRSSTPTVPAGSPRPARCS